MIKIIKDNNELIVTKGAYENTFKSLGYEVVKEQSVAKEVKEAKIVEEVVEKPATPERKESKSDKPRK